jgi:lipopolysaccharide/colanic/teichoic acid biosynthesis glycosyltransferase
MRVCPIVLDRRPSFMEGAPDPMSLLLTPLGVGRLLCDFHARLPSVVSTRLTIATAFAPTAAYLAALQRTCQRVSAVTPIKDLVDTAATLDPADWLLLADPLCFPADPIDARMVLRRLASTGSVIHLVAMNANPEGVTDGVQLDRVGSVRGVRRYYDARTWSYLAGVVCTLIPVATFLRFADLLTESDSLTEFRAALASAAVPSRDLPIPGEAMHLEREADLLRLSERRIVALREAASQWGAGASIDPTATLAGPVVVGENVIVEAGAAVIGPATLGPGSRIRAGAIVAQCLVGAGVEVQRNTVVSHRAIFHDRYGELPPLAAEPRTGLVSSPLSESVGDGKDEGHSVVYPLVKIVFDRVAAVAALVCLSPLLLLVGILIKLDSRGPVLYADLRETIGGRLFRCWKFRTMQHGAAGEQWKLAQKNQMDGPQFKINGDPRITRLGRWLRKVSIDELPQLLNVVTGDMSLVGPRPSPFRENQICVPWRQARLSVRAGITGLWQVARDERRNGDFHQWIYYDLLYVRHISWRVDLNILIATVLTFGGAGRVPSAWILPKRSDRVPDELTPARPVRATTSV